MNRKEFLDSEEIVWFYSRSTILKKKRNTRVTLIFSQTWADAFFVSSIEMFSLNWTNISNHRNSIKNFTDRFWLLLASAKNGIFPPIFEHLKKTEQYEFKLNCINQTKIERWMTHRCDKDSFLYYIIWLRVQYQTYTNALCER